MEFGPLEYAILGNGALLILLFLILAYTIHRLRKVSIKRNKLKKHNLAMEINSESSHQNFSTLCGLTSNQGSKCWSATLPLPSKKSVRIQESGTRELAPFNPYVHRQPPHQSLWIAFPHQPYFPGGGGGGGHFATLNIPLNKKSLRTHRCQRAHSCKMPGPTIHPSTPHKQLNLEHFYGKY